MQIEFTSEQLNLLIDVLDVFTDTFYDLSQEAGISHSESVDYFSKSLRCFQLLQYLDKYAEK